MLSTWGRFIPCGEVWPGSLEHGLCVGFILSISAATSASSLLHHHVLLVILVAPSGHYLK